MGVRSADDYRRGLADGRRIFYRGARVGDVLAHPELRSAVDHSALAFEIAGDQAVLATHAEGSLEAEKMQIARSYDPTSAVNYVRELAGIGG